MGTSTFYRKPGHGFLADPKLLAERYGTFAVATSPRELAEAKHWGLNHWNEAPFTESFKGSIESNL